MQKQQECVAVWWNEVGGVAAAKNNTTMIDGLCGS